VARLTAAGRMRPPGQRQVDAARADGRWDAAYAPMRAATVASIPEDLRAAIEADARARATPATLGRQNLFALAYRTNSMKTPAGRARKIASLVAMLARGEAIFPESGRGRKRHEDGTIVLTAVAVVPDNSPEFQDRLVDGGSAQRAGAIPYGRRAGSPSRFQPSTIGWARGSSAIAAALARRMASPRVTLRSFSSR